MNQEQKQLGKYSNDLIVKIATSVSTGESTTVEDVMENFGLDLYHASELFEDEQFLKICTRMSKMRAKLYVHSTGIAKLTRIADSDNDKSAIAAIKLIMDYTGDISKKSTTVNVDVSLENTIKQEEEKEAKGNIINITPKKKREVKELPAMRSIPVGNDPTKFNIEEVEEDMIEEYEFA